MNSDSYEYINAQQLTDSGGYAHISSTSNNTVVAAHKPGNGLIDFLMRTSHRLLSMKSNISQGALTSNDQLNRFKRGCREHAVNIGRDDPLAIFINSRSLQQVKSLLNVIRMSRDEDLPLTGVKLALYDHDIQVNLDQLARLMNDDLQRWAFGLINDEELDDAYFGNSPHHEPSLHFCDKIRTYRLVISIVLFVICFLVILATSAFIYRCANMRATKLEMERNIVPLDQLTCQENIRLFASHNTDITFITVQRGHTLRYFTYESKGNRFNSSGIFLLPTGERCTQISYHWACCKTLCIWWNQNRQGVRKEIRVTRSGNLSEMHITDLVDYICPTLHRTCSSKFPKLLLRSDDGLNAIFDLLDNTTIVSLVGPKKGGHSLLALLLYGNEAILLSNDEESNETQLCKSVHSTGVDPLDFRITRCWPIRLPLDISKARELAHFTIIRLSPTDFAVITSTTRNHHILWNLRFFELIDSDAIMVGDLSSASYACALATDVVVQVSADGRFVVVEFVMQSGRQLQLVRYSVRVPRRRMR